MKQKELTKTFTLFVSIVYIQLKHTGDVSLLLKQSTNLLLFFILARAGTVIIMQVLP